MMQSLDNTVIFMKNILNDKMNFIAYVLVTTICLISNYQNDSKLLITLARNLYFVSKDFTPHRMVRKYGF